MCSLTGVICSSESTLLSDEQITAARDLFESNVFRDAGAIVGQGGRSLEKGTGTDCDVIVTSFFTFKGSGGFRDCGAWDRNYLQGKRRVFFKLFSAEIVMHHGCALHFPL